MSSEPSRVNTKGTHGRTTGKARREAARGATLRRFALDALEARTLMTVLPPSVPTGLVNVYQDETGSSNASSPSIAIDKNNPQKMAATWTVNDPSFAPGQTEVVEYATSSDGGRTWSGRSRAGGFLGDPTTSNPVVAFGAATDASVAFDRNDNFYILYRQSKTATDNSTGALVLDKFNFTSSTASSVFQNNVVHEWTTDQAINPTLAVDESVGSFSDTDSSGATQNQSDPNAGNVYVAWASVDVKPAYNPNNYNPNRAELAVSSDGGKSFSSAVTVNDNGNFVGGELGQVATPRVAISQGSAPRAAGTNGPNDLGSPGVKPGQVTVVWDSYGINPNTTPPHDNIYSSTVTDTNVAQVFPKPGDPQVSGPINDAASGTPNSPAVTNFPINVNITDPKFLSVSDLTVNVALTHPALAELKIELIPPTGSGLQPITLVNNQTDQNGTANPFTGISGANLGVAPSGNPIGTTFDDNATRNIADFVANGSGRGAAAPFVGHYQPEGGSLLSLYGGKTTSQVNGTWTLRVTDFRNGNVGFLQHVSLDFTSGMKDRTDALVAQTLVRARQGGTATASAATAQGIGPDPVIASDNTLGAYSPYQGRLYVAFVDRLNLLGNPADNTDIFLATSDDGGQSWTRAYDQYGEYLPVNDDLATRDGYTEGSSGLNNTSLGSFENPNTGRPQFQPNVAVDDATGTLVMSWLDTRNDAARARTATYLTTSLDGGQTFSTDVTVNARQTATDAITGKTVDLGPIPDNQAAAAAEPVAGFGTHQGLAVYGGHAYPIWASNLNGGTDGKQKLKITTNVTDFAGGPRIIASTMGPIGQPGDTVNNQRAADGTPLASAFQVTFDRPIDPATFGTNDVRVVYRDTTASNATGGFLPVTSVTPINTGPFGATQFLVNFAPRSGVGTYSLEITPRDIRDRIRTATTGVVANGSPIGATSSDVPKTIPANSSASSTITVSGAPAGDVIAHLAVTLSISTQDASSLTLTLIAPDGTRVRLANHAPFPFAGGQNFTNTTFDDSGSQSIRQGFAPFTGTFRPETPLSQFANSSANGVWTLQVQSSLTNQNATLTSWSLSVQPGVLSTTPNTGNLMDQNANGTGGETNDFFATPGPVTGTDPFVLDPSTGNLAEPFSYSNVHGLVTNTLPLILPGPHVQSVSVPGGSPSPDNLVLNTSANAIDVTFDRDMDPSTITPNSILQVMGPAGPITGPFTITANPSGADPNPSSPRTYRIGFPTQTLNGTYTITLASTATDARGNALDTNLNAGLSVLSGSVSGPTNPVTYSSSTATPVPAGKTVVSTLNVPDNFLTQGLTVQLDVTAQNDPDLQITLVSPNNIPVVLVARGTGNTGTRANFTSTIFDDAAQTLIENGGPAFFGRFKPHSPLSALNGTPTAGAWKLLIDDSPTATVGARLNSWSLTFQKGNSDTGLGEPVADQATVSFRIFNMDPTNRVSSTTWTSVGPASIGEPGVTNNGYSGQVSAIAVDPSDPSGNTVYVGAGSGGIWKTTNFLTTDPNGPTYIPLTDFGPTFGVDIGSIAVFPRNNDPRQSIIIAGTGNGNTANYGFGGNTGQGVGFLRSMDGGATWTLLDSLNNNLPFSSRDHTFSKATTYGSGSSTMKVVVDPHLSVNGQVIVYAAMKGPSVGNTVGGLYRSDDSGTTWKKLSPNGLGDATDVTLDYHSATLDTHGDPTGNVNIVYAAFPGSGVYISPNQGQTLNLMAGGTVDPLIYDNTFAPPNAVPVSNGTVAPTSASNARIVLAKPAIIPASQPNADLENSLYAGWLYAADTDGTGHIDGVYLTKDYGQTWTKLKLSTLPSTFIPKRIVPSNDPTQPNYDPLSSGVFQHAGYNLSLAADPSNPNVVYLGGTANGNASGLIRIDATLVYDSHSVAAYDGSRPDGGLLQINTTGRTPVKDNTKTPSEFIGSSSTFSFASGPYLNLLDDPNDPFQTNSTLDVYNVASFTNDGSGVRYTPIDQVLKANANDSVPSSNLHTIVSIIDPLTGQSRLIFGDDNGVFTGVLNADGSVDTGIGTATTPNYSRNGNLAITQFYYGAAQPSSTLLRNQVSQALFYGNGPDAGQVSSDPNVLNNGNTVYQGSTQSSFFGGSGNPSFGGGAGFNAVTSGDQYGTGVQVDQQGNGTVYRFVWPDQGFAGNKTDFFQYSSGNGQFISRTSGLVQGANDPQWSQVNSGFTSSSYPNGLPFGNFTVNPLDGNQVLISSNAGRVFSTVDAGNHWLSIAEPSALDGTYAPALTYGAPDPSAPGGIGALNNFLYAGTVGGKIFVTRTGGGTSGSGNAWTNISNGLDGSPVVKILANPTRGSHEAYAVTQKGVYYIADSVTGTTWQNVTGNLFTLSTNPFGNAQQAQPSLNYLTSLQADWRYVIPNDPKGANPTGTHPMLYVSGDAGVYRSIDAGKTWAPFPNVAFDGSPRDGGYLPDVAVTDLQVSLGKIDPATGRAVAAPGDPNVLLASTYGRSQFAIRLAPVVFPGSITLDAKLPAPNGSVSGTDAQGHPIVTVAQPVIDGLSEQSAFGNVVRITLLDLTDPANPRIIGGYDPSNPATDVAANQTDASGRFSVQVTANGFTSTGIKTIGVMATDASGTQGNTASLVIDLQATLSTNTAPRTPSISLLAADDTSGGQNITRDTSPHVVGTTDPGVSVQLFIDSVNGVPTGSSTAVGSTTSDARGAYSIQLPSSPDGTYVVHTVATNQYGSTNSKPFSFTIKTTVITKVPTLTLSPADDTGIAGDNITSTRRPHFVGKTDPLAKVKIYKVVNGVQIPPVLATTSADPSGNYSIQLPYDLGNGAITLQVSVTDAAGNPGPNSAPLTVNIVSVGADYQGTGKTTPALFRRDPSGAGIFFVRGVTPATGTPFGGSVLDIPMTGDFDGDGVADLALYRPSTNTWYIRQSTRGPESFTLGTPGSEPAVGDFDGDGVSDPATFNPTTGVWSIAESSKGLQSFTFDASAYTPQSQDVPVPGNYDNLGADQLAVYRPSTGQFFIGTLSGTSTVASVRTVTLTTGTAGDVPVPGNYDGGTGNPRFEPAVYNPTTGAYLIQGTNGNRTQQLNPGDIPAPGDYNGVGYTQIAVYRPSVHTLLIVGNPTTTVNYGQAGDLPLTSPLVYRNVVAAAPTLSLDPGSDTGVLGDGITSNRRPSFRGTTDPNAQVDLFDPSTNAILGSGTADSSGNFVVQLSANGDYTDGQYLVQARAHGIGTTQGPTSPVVVLKVFTPDNDFTGSGRSTPTLFRRSSATSAQWFALYDASINGRSFGAGSLDVPVPGDYNGDGKTDLGVYRPSTGQWYLALSSTNYAGMSYVNFGAANDIPVPGKFYGNGITYPAVYRPSSGQFFVLGQASTVITPPRAGDVPVVGNFDNTSKDELAIYRPSTSQWIIQSPGGNRTVGFGGLGDIPVPGAYDASSTIQTSDLAFWRPSTGQYYILTSQGKLRIIQFAKGDIPAPGDYEGTGVTEAAVFRPGNATFYVAGPNDSTPRALVSNFGGANDIPVSAPYAFRKVGGITASSVSSGTITALDLGSTARTLSSGTLASSAPAAAPTTMAAPVNFASRARPRQLATAQPTHSPAHRLLKAHVAVKKGHHPA